MLNRRDEHSPTAGSEPPPRLGLDRSTTHWPATRDKHTLAVDAQWKGNNLGLKNREHEEFRPVE